MVTCCGALRKRSGVMAASAKASDKTVESPECSITDPTNVASALAAPGSQMDVVMFAALAAAAKIAP